MGRRPVWDGDARRDSPVAAWSLVRRLTGGPAYRARWTWRGGELRHRAAATRGASVLPRWVAAAEDDGPPAAVEAARRAVARLFAREIAEAAAAAGRPMASGPWRLLPEAARRRYAGAAGRPALLFRLGRVGGAEAPVGAGETTGAARVAASR